MSRNETKRSEIWLVLLLAAIFCLPGVGRAQGYFSASELDTLVANIALYPDPLLIQVLAASTYGEQIAPASEWANSHKHLKGDALSNAIAAAELPYDASVQALIPFPRVLSMMDRYAAWTDQLGDAVFIQKEDVMQAVQRLRRAANEHGHLRNDDYVKVTTGENITIMPVRTEYVYVPVYNPYVVYYNYYDGYVRVSYAPGVWLGTHYGYWGWGSCWFDWNARAIYMRDHRWHAPRRGPRHPHRYAPPPRRHERPVGPPLGERHSTVNYSSHQSQRPASAVRYGSGERHAQPERQDVRRTPNTSRYDMREEPRENQRYDLHTPRGSSSFNRHSDRGEPVDIANGRQSANTPPPPPPPSTRRDDQDRDDRGSSRGGFGGAIRRR